MNLAGFPAVRLRRGAALFRIHRTARGPWWFSSDGSGRFDPVHTPGMGACYLARDALGAWVEVFRKAMLIPEPEIHARALLYASSKRELRLADTTSRAALSYGVTASLSAGQDYSDSQRFASDAVDAGFDGVLYHVRHDPAQTLEGVALFGPAGGRDGDDPTCSVNSEMLLSIVVDQARTEFGYRVVPVP